LEPALDYLSAVFCVLSQNAVAALAKQSNLTELCEFWGEFILILAHCFWSVNVCLIGNLYLPESNCIF
jgi:hypothetical protein